MAFNDDLKEFLESWDIAQTEKALLAKLEDEKEKRAKARKDLLTAETNKSVTRATMLLRRD